MVERDMGGESNVQNPRRNGEARGTSKRKDRRRRPSRGKARKNRSEKESTKTWGSLCSLMYLAIG